MNAHAQVWPFFLWAVFVIVLNAVEFQLLSTMGSSLSLLNIVNFLLLRHHYVFFYVQVGEGVRAEEKAKACLPG